MSSRSSASASTASLVSHQQSRDYSAAFGTLASSYGSSGTAPCHSSSKTASHLAMSTEPSSKHLRSQPSREPASLRTSAVVPSDKLMMPRSQDLGALMDKYGASTSMTPGQSSF
ncbi:hypothetical protein FRC12_006225 [Ceratobasidium sp. 428]|nr:hypothetical protein FRC12_006225 [Ceratobasidium sp. 428]